MACRDLSHLYHYYLHPDDGKKADQTDNSPEPKFKTPKILIRCMSGSRLAWEVNLAEIADDMESRYQQVGTRTLQCSCNPFPSKRSPMKQ